MNKKIGILLIVALLNASILPGCWNYREINELAVVAGFAVDWNTNTKDYTITVEIINPKQNEEQTKMNTEIITMNGRTVFEAVRNIVMRTGKKLYWSHAKILIIGQDILLESIIPVLDWVYRDAEVREDIWLIASMERPAREIFLTSPVLDDAISFELSDIFRSGDVVSKYETKELWDLVNEFSIKGASYTIPTISVIYEREEMKYQVSGSAIIKDDKIAGFLDQIETRSMRWIRNDIGGGLVVALEDMGEEMDRVTLEILRAGARLKAKIKDEKLIIDIKAKTNVAIGEIDSQRDYISEGGRQLLQKKAEEEVTKQFKEVIAKAQKEYKADIFGFGEVVEREMPSLWKEIENNWEEVFSKLDVEVNVEINVIGSALKSEPIRIED